MTTNVLKQIIYLAVISLLSIEATSQNKVLTIPIHYLEPNGKLVDKDAIRLKSNDSRNIWTVFSDQANNQTYADPGESIPLQKLNFLETCYVVDETETHIKLIKYNPSILGKKNRIIGKAKELGWIRKSKMLLWSNSLVNNKRFTIKALTVNKVESLQNRESFINGKDQIRLFDSPFLLPASENNNTIRLFQFLYVFKESEKAYLIGKSEQTTIGYADTHILGWIAKDIVQIWDQRVVLEPSEGTAQARQDKKIKTTVFSTKSAAESFKNASRSQSNKVLWDRDPFGDRPEPRWKRLPVLEMKDDIVRTGVTTDLFDEKGSIVIKSDEQIELEETYNQARDRFRNVNIVFVVDGTKSVEPYFPSITNAIRNISGSLTRDSKNTYRIGAVVYRDYPHAKCEKGDRSFHTQSLSLDPNRVASFFDRVKEAGFCTNQDRDLPEAMYMGLHKGLRMLANHPKQTNVVILIGDAGNHLKDPQIKQSELVNLMKRSAASLLAYQVTNGTDPSFIDFVDQTKNIILSVSKSISTGNPKFQPSNKRSYSLNYPEESAIMGAVTFAELGTPMRREDLEQGIISFVKTINDYQEELLAEMDKIIRGLGRVTLDARIWDFVKRRMGITNPRELQRIVNHDNNFQLYVDGYTPLNANGTKLYDYAIFVNNNELEGLMSTLSKIINTRSTLTKRREELHNVLVEILSTTYGKREVREIINTKTTGEIMELITNLPTQNTCPWPNVRDKKVTEREIDELINCVEDKYFKLQKISGNPAWFFRSNDISYYWVPASLLP